MRMVRSLAVAAVFFLPMVLASGQQPATVPSESKLFVWSERRVPGAHERWVEQNESLLASSHLCRVSVSWMDQTSQLGSGVHELADFIVEPDRDGEVTKQLPGPKAELQPRVGIQFIRSDSKLSALSLAIAMDGKPGDVFYEISRAEASTIIKSQQSWTNLSVSKLVQLQNVTYTFRLSCQPGSAYLTTYKQLFRKR